MLLRFTLIALGAFLYGASGYGAEKFGYDGRGGRDGYSGNPGMDGPNRTIRAVGDPIRIDVRGLDGRRAEDGERGDDAFSCNQPCPPNDVIGADGGNGGRGGVGGDGGDGGIVTIHYEDSQALERVFIDANHGIGGPGGYGAEPGRPCFCSVPSWEARHCRTVTNPDGTTRQECWNETHYCRAGEQGWRGRAGSSGRDGRLGSIVLINKLEDLRPTTPSRGIPLTSLASEGAAVSANRWESLTGARDLIARGSVISDRYRRFVERVEQTYSLDWQANRPVADFGEFEARIFLDDFRVRAAFPDNVWLLGEEQRSGSGATFAVEAAVTREEVRDIDITGMTGSGGGLTVFVDDNSSHSDLIATSFFMRYDVKWGLLYFNKYGGTVPSDLIDLNDGRYTIAVGQLPLRPQHVRSGRDVRVRIWIKRQFAERETEVFRQFYHRIQ